MSVFKLIKLLVTSAIIAISAGQAMAVTGYPLIQVTVYNKTYISLKYSGVQLVGSSQIYQTMPINILEPELGFVLIQFQPTNLSVQNYGITFSLYDYYTDATGQQKQSGCSYVITCTGSVKYGSTSMYYCPTENVVVSATSLAPDLPMQPVCVGSLTKQIDSSSSSTISTIVNINMD